MAHARKATDRLRRPLAWAAALAAALALALRGSVGLVAWWLDFSEEPVPADFIVVLAGDFRRPAYGADLFRAGLAPEVWIGRPRREGSLAFLDREGLKVPVEEDLNAALLLKHGVPADRVRRFGRALRSTVDEARAFAREARPEGKRVLVVTSRYHARRSRLVFRDALRRSEVRVCASPYEEFDRRWWTHQDFARNAVLETAKTLYYLLGGAFASTPAT